MSGAFRVMIHMWSYGPDDQLCFRSTMSHMRMRVGRGTMLRLAMAWQVLEYSYDDNNMLCSPQGDESSMYSDHTPWRGWPRCTCLYSILVHNALMLYSDTHIHTWEYSPFWFYHNISVFYFNIKDLINSVSFIQCVLCGVQGICMCEWMGHLYLSMQSVTKHRDQSPSPMSVNWASDGVGIDFIEYMCYKSGCFYNSLE